MTSSLKWKLLFALLLVFVAGGMTGGLVCSTHMRRHFFGPPRSGEMSERFREHLKRALDLTPEQSVKISPIIDSTSAKLDAIRVETAQKVRTTMEESERLISPQLTPDQREKLQSLKHRHEKALMRHGMMPPPEPPPEEPPPSP
jgi:Spy/CpxP family protein refolding chaperone